MYHLLFENRKIFQDAISLKIMNHETMCNTIWTIIPFSCLQNVSNERGGEGEGSVSSGSMIVNFQQKKLLLYEQSDLCLHIWKGVYTVGKASKRFSRRLVLRLAF